MATKLKRIKGIVYPSSLSLVPRKREYIVDVYGYYKILGLDPNEKNWSSHEIKKQFRKLFKKQGHDEKLIEAYRVLSCPERVSYDSLTKSMERMIQEVYNGSRIINSSKKKEKVEETYAYFVDEGIEEDYETALQWMKHLSTFNHRNGNESSAKIVLSDHFKKEAYSWGELVYVNTNYKPALDVLVYFLLKDTQDNWYIEYCKISRKWD